MQNKKITSQKGFTMIEIIIVIVIIGILSSIGFVALNGYKENNAKKKSDLSLIMKTIQMYYLDQGVMPTGSYGDVAFCTIGKPADPLYGDPNNICLNDLVTKGYIKSLPIPPDSSTYLYYAPSFLTYIIVSAQMSPPEIGPGKRYYYTCSSTPPNFYCMELDR